MDLASRELDIILVVQHSQITDQSAPTITIMCPLLQINDNNEHFVLKKAMELNHKLTIETLSISNRWLIISSTYFIDEMSKKEIIDMIDNLSYQAHYIENKNLFMMLRNIIRQITGSGSLSVEERLFNFFFFSVAYFFLFVYITSY